MWQVILGRVLSGSAASGMASLILVLTTGNFNAQISDTERETDIHRFRSDPAT